MNPPVDYRSPLRQEPAFIEGRGAVRHPAEKASWIWIDHNPNTRFLRFSIEFDTPANDALRFHVTADQRFQLRIDGKEITYGPDRSDLESWRVTTCEVPLRKGHHQIELLVWWINEDLSMLRAESKSGEVPPPNPPMAQMSWRAGFLFVAEGSLASVLNTGSKKWKVQDLTEAVCMARKSNLGYHDVGAGFTIDLGKWHRGLPEQSPVCVAPPDAPNLHGVRRPGWVLAEHTLPEQSRVAVFSGRFRIVRSSFEESPFLEQELADPALADWNALLHQNKSLTIPANRQVTAIWDLDQYACGYPQFGWSKGAGATVEVEWAESLYQGGHSDEVDAFSPKGNRSELAKKVWLGFGDTFICYGADDETSPGLWWRSGRYIRIRIRTKTEPLTLNRVEVLSSGYPIAPSSRWNSSDNEWDRLFPLLHRGLELCAHETWIDSPYYEQLMYTGDTRLHCLSNYASYTDTRLSRSAIELFDSSRPGSLEGLVAERYPSAWRQDSFTYALIWTWMVRDYMLWQNDLAFIREKTIGVRQMMERILAMRRKNGLLGPVPGWPFVDWVEQWNEGCGPGVREGDSSIINLHLVLSLQAAAELEIALGEKTLAARWNTIARQTMDTLLNRYWDNTSNLLLDSLDCDLYSEHVQALALLTGLLDDTQEKACLEALASGICKTKCSIYFSFYLLEAYACTDTVGLFFEKLAFWRGLPAQGFKSLPESPEPTRSDCHGWGAHPIYHSYASIAGIRPAAPGFQRIRIAPMPGHLEDISLSMPHPDGEISFAFEKRNGTVRFEINLPNGIPGELHWAGKTYCLANSQTVEIPEHGSLPSREQKGMAEREGFEPSVHR